MVGAGKSIHCSLQWVYGVLVVLIIFLIRTPPLLGILTSTSANLQSNACILRLRTSTIVINDYQPIDLTLTDTSLTLLRRFDDTQQ